MPGGHRDRHTRHVNPNQSASRLDAFDGSRVVRLMGTALGLGLFSAAMWFAWLGWDDEYHQVDGVAQGPYRAWQVLGCALSIAAAAVVAYLRVHGAWAVLVLAAAADIGFAVPWALDAASTDVTGLWALGLLFLLVGVGFGLAVLLAVTGAAATPRPARLRSDD